MKVFLTKQFDKAITDELALNVKARLSFKALFLPSGGLQTLIFSRV